MIIITIPAYNEEKTIGKVIRDIHSVMKSAKYNYKVLVVNDGSTDKTSEVAEKAGAIVKSHPQNYGLASTFRTEVEECLKLKADIIVHTDADGQYLAEEIPKLIKGIEKGYDLVLGSRFRGTIESMPFIKKFGNMAFSKVLSNITHKKITDGQTGFRAFTKEVAEKIKIISNHTYTQEQIIRAVRDKFKVVETPVYFAKRAGDGKSRLMSGPLDYALKAWVNILRVYRDYEPLKFFGYVGGALLLLGALLGIYIFSYWILYDQVGGIPRVVLTALLMLTGLQIIIFGFLADMQRK